MTATGVLGHPVTEIDFVKLSPTRNMTVLVTSQHPEDTYPAIATALLSDGHVHAEQVGFVRRATHHAAQARLHMAGEEFCGNACMALAALTAAGLGADTGAAAQVQVTLEVSGSEHPVTCRVVPEGAGHWCELSVPLPRAVEPYPFPGVGPGRAALVRYADVVHLVVECGPPDHALRASAEQVAARLVETEAVPVVGVMLLDRESQSLAPLVVVPGLGTAVWEHGCGSGTASVGAHLAAAAGTSVTARLQQPGGTMHVRAEHDGRGLTDLRVSGHVHVVAEGKAYVHA